MPRDPVVTLRAAVKLWNDRLAPGLFGLACSGGADSMALADAAIAEFGAANVVVIHIDHGLSPGSAAVGEQVAAWARGQGVGAVVRRVQVARRASIEAAARDARYAALDAIANEIGAHWVLLGHTARDQAETVLLRMVRGTGPPGLAGIPVIRGRFVRPLLDVPREVIDEYVAARALPTWLDPMNEDHRIARVRFREQHLPALRAENPALDQALCRLAMAAREWTAALDTAAEPVARFPMSCRLLLAFESAVRKRAYALALEEAGHGYDAVHLEAIDSLVLRSNGGEHAVDVPGARVVRSYDALTVLMTGGKRVSADAGRSQARDVATSGDRDAVSGALVCPAGPYELRTWRAGDRMKPARLKGRSRKLSDLFIDAKIPRAARAFARVLVRTTDGVIVWAEHVGLAFGEPLDIAPQAPQTGGSF
jgi:tRNA(Ile)-lysidine synthase